MGEHVILVAFSVSALSESDAQHALMDALPNPVGVEDRGVTSWWIAEDKRYDGSDNDSAVFVTPGRQVAAARLLFRHGLTPYHNIPEEAGE